VEYHHNKTGNGQITLGGFDTENCADIIGYVNLSSSHVYKFQLDSYRYGDKELVMGVNSTVVSDSGTYCLLTKPEIAKPIALASGAVFNIDIGAYLIACNATYAPLTFIINGQEYSLTSRTLSMDIGLGNQTCMFGVVPVDLGDWSDWILGTPFIQEFCTVYDVGQKRLGFAPSRKYQRDDRNSAETSMYLSEILIAIIFVLSLFQ